MTENICVLVVDDFSTMRRIIKKVLKGIQIENVVEADNGISAWEKLNAQTDPPIELIICDWNMPGMTGMELLEKVRSDERLSDIPFIMVTAEGKDKIDFETGKADLTSYIAKPFKANELEEKINLILGK
ncbi:MAG: response regulator [Thermodesulfobacteriota bacterium]